MLKGFLQTHVGQVVFGVVLVVSWLWFLGMLTWGVVQHQMSLQSIITAVLPVVATLSGGAGVHYITNVVNSNGKNGNGNGSNGSGGH